MTTLKNIETILFYFLNHTSCKLVFICIHLCCTHIRTFIFFAVINVIMDKHNWLNSTSKIVVVVIQFIVENNLQLQFCYEFHF